MKQYYVQRRHHAIYAVLMDVHINIFQIMIVQMGAAAMPDRGRQTDAPMGISGNPDGKVTGWIIPYWL